MVGSNKKIDRPWLTKHGDSRTKLYYRWQSIKYRCYLETDTAYKKYGAKGITVCQEWRDSYTAFKEWALANGYKEGLTIDRKDGAGNYCPENCRWVDYLAQNTNLRKLKTNTSGYRGIFINKGRGKKYLCNISINNKTKYIGSFDTIEEAIAARTDFISKNNLPHQPAEF
jgi:hypothetical protein